MWHRILIITLVAVVGFASWPLGDLVLVRAAEEPGVDEPLIDDTDPFGIQHGRSEGADDGYYTWRVEVLDLQRGVAALVDHSRNLLEDRYQAIGIWQRRLAWLMTLYRDATKPPERGGDNSPWIADADGFLYIGDPAVARRLRLESERPRPDRSLESVGRTEESSERVELPPPPPDMAVWGPAAIQSNLRRQRELEDSIKAAREEQREIMSAARAAMDELVASVEDQARKSSRRPETDFNLILARLRDKRTLSEIELYDAAGWYGEDELRALIALARFEEAKDPNIPKQKNALLLLRTAEKLEKELPVKLALAGGDAAASEDAIRTIATNRSQGCAMLYEILREQPANAEAKTNLIREEQHYLTLLMAKLEQERKSNLDAFYSYLANRGFEPNDRSGWYDVAAEYASGFWSMGLGTIYLAHAENVPTWTENYTSTTGDEIARDQIALLTIRRLLRNGLTVREIKALNSEKLLELVEAKRADGRPIDLQKAHKLAADVHAAFMGIPELRLLAEGDIQKFHEAFKRPFYELLSGELSWPEYFADCVNVKNLFTFLLPNAVTKIGGKWVWTGRFGKEFYALEALGDVERFSTTLAAGLHSAGGRAYGYLASWFEPEVIGTTGRLAKIFGPSGPARKLATKAGAAFQWFQGRLAADRAFMEGLSTWDYFKRAGARMIGVGVLYTFGGQALEEMGFERASVLVDIMVSVGVADIVYDAMTWSGRPLKQMARALDRLGDSLKQKEDDLAKLAIELQKAEHLSRLPNVTAGDLDDIVKQVRSAPGQGTRRVMAELDDVASLEDLICMAAGKLKKGESAECLRAVRAAEQILNREKWLLATKRANLDRALRILREHVRPDPLSRASRAAYRPIKEVPPERFLKTAAQELFDHAEWGGPLGRAHELFRKGNFDDALKEYSRVRQLAQRVDWGTGDDQLLKRLNDYLEQQMVLVRQAQEGAQALAGVRGSAARLMADADLLKPSGGTAPIEQVVKAVQDGTYVLEKMPDKAIYVVRDRQTNAIVGRLKKIPAPAPGSILDALGHDATRLAQDECAGNALYNALSDAMGGTTRAPAACPLTLPGSILPGETEQSIVAVFSRNIDGMDFRGLTEPEILAHHRDVVTQRIFRSWIGDTDGHFGNLMRGADGRTWAIDFGFAEFENALLKQNTTLSVSGARDYVEKALNLPNTSPFNAYPLYQYMSRFDEMIHPGSDAAIRTIGAINQLAKDKEALKNVLRGHLPEGRLDRAADVLRDRAKALWDVLNKVVPAKPRFGLLAPRSRIPERLGPRGWRAPAPALALAA